MTTEPIPYDADTDKFDLSVYAASGSRYFISIRPAELERLRQALAAPTSPVAAVPAPVQGADPTGPQTDADGEHTAIRDADGRFLGHRDRECGEHRTVGAHRAWCHDDGEWCYPGAPCARCELPAVRERAELAAAERERADKAEAERDAARRWANEADAIATDILCIVEKVSDWDASEYHARLAELRAGAKEAQGNG